MSTTLTFDESAVETIVGSFGRVIDSEGYVFDPKTGKREVTPDGEEISKEHFAGLEDGSVIFLDDDFNTLVEHLRRRRGE